MLSPRSLLVAAFVACVAVLSSCSDVQEPRAAIAPAPETSTTHMPVTSTTSTTFSPAAVALFEKLDENARWVRLWEYGRALERTQAAAKRAQEKAERRAAVSYSSLQPCGGDLPPCYVKARESGGNYGAYNPTGCGGRSCGGAWQFDPRTWNNYGGYPEAQLAPPEVQDAKARELWAGGAGCSHWASC